MSDEASGEGLCINFTLKVSISSINNTTKTGNHPTLKGLLYSNTLPGWSDYIPEKHMYSESWSWQDKGLTRNWESVKLLTLLTFMNAYIQNTMFKNKSDMKVSYTMHCNGNLEIRKLVSDANKTLPPQNQHIFHACVHITELWVHKNKCRTAFGKTR